MVTVRLYRGFDIVWNAYKRGEITINIEGDDVFCKDYDEAKEVIDDYLRRKNEEE